MRVLMVGATGRYAHLVVPELVKRGVAVRALVRSEQRAEVARANGATDTVIGDLSTRRASPRGGRPGRRVSHRSGVRAERGPSGAWRWSMPPGRRVCESSSSPA